MAGCYVKSCQFPIISGMQDLCKLWVQQIVIAIQKTAGTLALTHEAVGLWTWTWMFQEPPLPYSFDEQLLESMKPYETYRNLGVEMDLLIFGPPFSSHGLATIPMALRSHPAEVENRHPTPPRQVEGGVQGKVTAFPWRSCFRP